MKFEFDREVMTIALPFFIVGFGLIWWQVGFLTALGASLVGIAMGVRRTNG